MACRGAVVADPAPVGVLTLAFPLLAPARKDGTRGDRSPEIDAVDAAGIPVLAVSGDRDPFGVPPAAAHREVVTVRGDHSLRTRARSARPSAPGSRRCSAPDRRGASGAVLTSDGSNVPLLPWDRDYLAATAAVVADAAATRSAGASSTCRPRRPALQNTVSCSSAEASTTTGRRRFVPSGLIPPVT